MGLPEFTELEPATLRAAAVAARDQAWLHVDPPPGFFDAHTHPGQFCKIRVGEHEGIFAMFSSPAEREARFLVRVGNPVGGEAADALAALEGGATIEMTGPAGAGFALEQARGRDVRFVATGTGVAPVRAAIEAVLAERDAYGALSLDHGLQTAEHLAIADDVARWQARGVEVRLCYSRLDEAEGLVGVTVQDSLRAHVGDLRDACVVAVGQTRMLTDLLAVMSDLGAPAERLLTNI